MNGRIYDPKLGRMLQADPFIQSPTNSQSLNRYSYVLNNPLSYTDPSGYFSFSSLWKKWIRPIAAIVISIYLPQFTAFWGALGVSSTIAIGAVTGAVAGYVGSGNLAGALAGAFAGGAFGALHQWNAVGNLAKVGKSIAHGVVGGVQNLLQGAKFGHGFFSAGVTQGFAGPIGRISDRFARVIVAAAVGGTISELTGGKFANGAVTGAFSRALNDEAHRDSAITEEQRTLAADGDVEGFWRSRLNSGDPIARSALRSMGIKVGILDSVPGFDVLFGGASINNRLQAFSQVYAGGELDLNAIRVDLMHAHVRAATLDIEGIHGLLNPRQAASYHHDVFRGYGLPSTAFGGTPFTGSLQEANLYRSIWCGGCDR